jgi:hypothetical protein
MGAYADVRALRAALKEARSALAAATAAPVVRAAAAERDERLRLGWLVVALVPALLLVVGAAVLGGLRGLTPDPAPGPQPLPVPSPAPRVAPLPAPEPFPAPIPAPSPARAPEHAPAPDTVPIEVVALPPPEEPPPPVVRVEVVPPPPVAVIAPPPPIPPPAPPPPAPAPRSRWNVSSSGGATVLSVDAEALVADRLGRAGRPRLELRCDGGKLSVAVEPGVEAVETLPAELAYAEAVATVPGADGAVVRLRVHPDDPMLYFPQPQRWLSTFRERGRLDLSYTPFASPAVVAGFDLGGLDDVAGSLGHCAR